jgi:hypothetical protein
VRSDIDAVAGFFEDLPVLIYVLSGTLVLASSATWAAQFVSESRDTRSLGHLAESLADKALAEIRNGQPDWHLPTVRSLEGLNLSHLGDDLQGRKFAISITMRHPTEDFVFSAGMGDLNDTISTGFCSRFLNALTDDGLVAILELRVIVWHTR